MVVQEVKWDKEGMLRAGDYNFFYGKGNENYQWGRGFFVHHRIVSAAKRVEFVSRSLPLCQQSFHICELVTLCPSKSSLVLYLQNVPSQQF